jgi:flagellar assembly protein FliH
MPGVIRKERVAAASAFSFADLERQAADVLAHARAQAAAILAEAESQAAALCAAREAEARERGLAEGRREGLEQITREASAKAAADARDRLNKLAAALEAALREFEQQRHNLLADAEHGLIELALAIARRVCKHDAARSSAAAAANAHALLALVQHQADAELLLNPADFAALHEALAALTQSAARMSHVKLAADESVTRGGCRLRGVHGELDATLETQLDRIAAALLGEGAA